MMDNASSSPPSPVDTNLYYWEILELLAKEPTFNWLREVLFPQANSGQPQPTATGCSPQATTGPRDDHAAPTYSFSEDDPAILEACEARADAAAIPEVTRSKRAPPDGETALRPRRRQCCNAQEELSSRKQVNKDTWQHPLGPWPLKALRLVEHAVEPRIWRAYNMGLQLFMAFREETGFPSTWPIPVNQIRGFLVAMDSQGIPSPNISMYLTGLSYISRMFNFQDPLQDFFTSQMVAGLLSQRPDRVECCPLTTELLRCLVGTVETVCRDFYERLLFRAVFILSFFAALRPEEVLAEHPAVPHSEPLLLSDIDLSDESIGICHRVLERSAISLRLREHWVCPVLALQNYVAVRPKGEGLLFIYGNRELLTKQQFFVVFYAALRLLGLPPHHYSLHSFWLGSVMCAARYRHPREVILRLARWLRRGIPRSKDD